MHEGDLLRAPQLVSCRSRCKAILAQASGHYLSQETKTPCHPLKGQSRRCQETLCFWPWPLFWKFSPKTHVSVFLASLAPWSPGASAFTLTASTDSPLRQVLSEAGTAEGLRRRAAAWRHRLAWGGPCGLVPG